MKLKLLRAAETVALFFWSCGYMVRGMFIGLAFGLIVAWLISSGLAWLGGAMLAAAGFLLGIAITGAFNNTVVLDFIGRMVINEEISGYCPHEPVQVDGPDAQDATEIECSWITPLDGEAGEELVENEEPEDLEGISGLRVFSEGGDARRGGRGVHRQA
jgi:hypothetical protein